MGKQMLFASKQIDQKAIESPAGSDRINHKSSNTLWFEIANSLIDEKSAKSSSITHYKLEMNEIYQIIYWMKADFSAGNEKIMDRLNGKNEGIFGYLQEIKIGDEFSEKIRKNNPNSSWAKK